MDRRRWEYLKGHIEHVSVLIAAIQNSRSASAEVRTLADAVVWLTAIVAEILNEAEPGQTNQEEQ